MTSPTGSSASTTRPMAALALGLLVGLAAAAHADPADWPRAFDTASGAFIIYEPQPEALDGDVLSGRAAFSLQRSGSAEPSFGVLWFTEHIQIDRDSSTVAARAYFLSGADLWYQAKDPLGPWHVILGPPDEVRAVVPPDTSAADRTVGPPPQVLTATEPTELIATDGPPAYAPLVDDELLYVT